MAAVQMPFVCPGTMRSQFKKRIAKEPIEPSRQFDPARSRRHRPVPESELVIYNAPKDISQFQYAKPSSKTIATDTSSLVVQIAGTCHNEGWPTAQASWSVYFGPDSRYNECGRVWPDLPQTSANADIEALAQALDIISGITAYDLSIQTVCIVSSSKYLVNALTVWMEGWIKNDGRNAMGRAVTNFQVLRALYDKVEDLEFGLEGGVEAKFWHVPRDRNADAEMLAAEALPL